MNKILWIIARIITIFALWNNIALANGWFWISNRVNWINVPKTDDQNVDDKALIIVTDVVNRILSLTSVVAIIIFVIWGYRVITAWWDDSKAKSWYKYIKNAIIWLLIIWLTWAMIRLIFRFVNWMVWEHSLDEA